MDARPAHAPATLPFFVPGAPALAPLAPPAVPSDGGSSSDAAFVEDIVRAALCDYVGAGVVPTHTLVVSGVPPDTGDSDVWALLRGHGEVAAVAAAPGARLATFFDLRAACRAYRALGGRCVLHGRVCAVAFAVPGSTLAGGSGRCALAVCGAPSALTAGALFRLCSQLGDVRDVRVSSSSSSSGCGSSGCAGGGAHVVEYFDTRCAARAARCLHRAVLLGCPLTVGLFDPRRETPLAALAAPAVVCPGAPPRVVLSPPAAPPPALLSPLTRAFFASSAAVASPPALPPLSPVTAAAAAAAAAPHPLRPGTRRSVSATQLGAAARAVVSEQQAHAGTRRQGGHGYSVCVVDGRVADARTTLMIRNIPNKYTQAMLRAQIDRASPGCYDFLYLPVDFRNRCNVGYAFVNVVAPARVPALYAALHRQRWECFRSEKVCELAYARIQGLDQLLGHFKNSSLLAEDKDVRPVILLNGRYVPFPDPSVPVRVLTTATGKVFVAFVLPLRISTLRCHHLTPHLLPLPP